ncbi:MAG: ribbon-helix-helix domain-containing protein [Candidatus Binataceae bacterium]
MNFSIHLDDKLVEQLNRPAAEMGKSRNAIIREAVHGGNHTRDPPRCLISQACHQHLVLKLHALA